MKKEKDLAMLVRKMVTKWDSDRGKLFKKYVKTEEDEKEVLIAIKKDLRYLFGY